MNFESESSNSNSSHTTNESAISDCETVLMPKFNFQPFINESTQLIQQNFPFYAQNVQMLTDSSNFEYKNLVNSSLTYLAAKYKE